MWIELSKRKKKNLPILETSFSCFGPFGVWGVTQTPSHPNSDCCSTSSRKPKTKMQPGDVVANSKESKKELYLFNS